MNPIQTKIYTEQALQSVFEELSGNWTPQGLIEIFQDALYFTGDTTKLKEDFMKRLEGEQKLYYEILMASTSWPIFVKFNPGGYKNTGFGELGYQFQSIINLTSVESVEVKIDGIIHHITSGNMITFDCSSPHSIHTSKEEKEKFVAIVSHKSLLPDEHDRKLVSLMAKALHELTGESPDSDDSINVAKLYLEEAIIRIRNKSDHTLFHKGDN